MSHPPSVYIVFLALKEAGRAMRHADLHEQTKLPKRTLRFAVRRLQELELLTTKRSLKDTRIAYFILKPGAKLEA